MVSIETDICNYTIRPLVTETGMAEDIRLNNSSILYGRGQDGQLHHIDEVDRGADCNCTCPDPRCDQPLVARQGELRAHHFAHKPGTKPCGWAVEYVLSEIAERIVAESHEIVFPKLTFHNSVTDREETIAESQPIGISAISRVYMSGRGNPELLITRKITGGERQFLVVITFTHPLSSKQVDLIKETGLDSFHVDLRKIYGAVCNQRRSEDPHFDRTAIQLEFQDERFLKFILVGGDGSSFQWLSNAIKTKEEEKSRLEAFSRKRQTIIEGKAQAFDEMTAEERSRITEELNQQERRVVDCFGNRWLRCEVCGREGTEEYFQSYGGFDHINLGLCYECARSNRKMY